MPDITWAQTRQVAEHGDRLVGIAPTFEGMCQLVSGLGADRSRGCVEPNGFVAAR